MSTVVRSTSGRAGQRRRTNAAPVSALLPLAIAPQSPKPSAESQWLGNRGATRGVCASKSRVAAQTLTLEGGTVTMNDTEPQFECPEPPDVTDAPTRQGPVGGAAAALIRVLRRGPVIGALAAVAIVALVGGAYVVGSPAGSGSQFALGYDTNGVPIATAGPADMRFAANGGGTLSDKSVAVSQSGTVPAPAGAVDATTGEATSPDQAPQLTSIEAAQIVKTGALSLEVSDIDQTSTLAKAAIAGLGGYVSQSNRSGSGDYTIASITFRVPSDKWDQALEAIRKLGSKTISEETNSTDVTSQVIDLDARLDNLKRTETALQLIMDKAVIITDVLAVQNQLTQVQGQIEQLTAQRDHLKSQAAMSTLTTTFQLPSKTVTTQAAQGWTLSDQVDQAGAALVRVGQGLATMGVWVVVVFLPIGFAALALLIVVKLLRRIVRRGGRQNESVGA
jgi:Domain of unknown function (DUF4349)